jgi:hypothetical protein
MDIQDFDIIDIDHASNYLLHGCWFNLFHFMNSDYTADFVLLFELDSK